MSATATVPTESGIRNVTTLAQHLSRAIGARARCAKSGNAEWQERWSDDIRSLQRDFLPHGSGIDGTEYPLDEDKSTPERLVFNVDYHAMDDNGMYCGWYSYRVTVRASLETGLCIRVTGRDRNGAKDWIRDMFDVALSGHVGSVPDGNGGWRYARVGVRIIESEV